MAQQRPWAKRSRNARSSGATIANGSIVSARNSATWPRGPGHREEERARERDRDGGVAAVLKRCMWISREETGLAGALGIGGAPRSAS